MSERVARRLTVIVSADVVGYSRLIGIDEAGTRAALGAHRAALIDPAIADHGGRIVGTAGDSLLVEFESVVAALECGVAVQAGMETRNADLPDDRRIVFRVGINLGEVIVEGDDIHGDGVNVAARLQALAEPGSICVSAAVREQVGNRTSLGFDDLGPQSLKNIAEPVRAYRVVPAVGHADTADRRVRAAKPRSRRRWAIGAAAAIVAISATAAGVLLSLEPWVPRVEAAVEADMAYPLPEKPSLVVLPFAALGVDPDNEWFADGVTTTLVSHLLTSPKLFVIDRHSSYAYKGKPVTVKQIAEELGIRYVLQGTVQASGDQLRITAQLTDALSGQRIWSERYSPEKAELFALQDEITRNISVALSVELFGGETTGREYATRSGTNLKAWEYDTQAVEHFVQGGVGGSAEENSKARELWQKAFEIGGEQPNFLTGLAWTHLIDLIFQHTEDPAASSGELKRLTARAYELDDTNPIVHRLLGAIAGFERRYDDAIRHMERAIVLGPNLAGSHADLGFWLVSVGRAEEAIERLEHAMRLSPVYPDYFVAWLGYAYFDAGRFADALEAHRSFAERLPDSVQPHLSLALTHWQLGNTDAAKAEVERVLEVSPDYSIAYHRGLLRYRDPAQSEQLLDWIRQLGIPEHPPPPLPDKPSIAVMPFANMSGDPAQDYFADGMTETLITDLSRLSELFVIARNTSFSYKGKSLDLKAVGRELGVRYLLEGSVQRAGGRVRINAQLIDAATGGHIWSDRFDHATEDIFALQDEAIERIVSALPIVSREHRPAKKAPDPPTKSIDAYDLYLRGMQTLHSLVSADLKKSIELFNLAVELDPEFPEAWAALTWAWTELGEVSTETTERGDAGLMARATGMRARRVAPHLPQTHLAWARQYIANPDQKGAEHGRALQLAEKAVALAPRDPDVLAQYAETLNFNGRSEEARHIMNTAFRLNPTPPAKYALTMAYIHFHSGQYAEAIEHALRFSADAPRSYMASWVLAPAYAYLGEPAKAQAQVEILLSHRPEVSLETINELLLPGSQKERGRAIEGFRLAGLQTMVDGREPRGERLTGEEVSALLAGRTISGRDLMAGTQWWFRQATDGTALRWDDDLEEEVTGRFAVEDDWACWEWDAPDEFRRCDRIYRDPEGSAEHFDQYTAAGTRCICAFAVVEE